MSQNGPGEHDMEGTGATAEAQNESNAWNTFLMSLRYREGRISELVGNNPIVLDDADYAWFVYRGKADVFVSHVESGQPVGARTHLFRVSDRHAVFGMSRAAQPEGESTALALLVGGAQGTQLLRVSRATLDQLGREEFADLVAMVLDNWISLLSSTLTSALPPRDHEVLEPGREISLGADQVAYPRRGVVWVKHLAGSSQVAGATEIALGEADGFFPISMQTWLRPTQAMRLQVIDTQAGLKQGDVWNYLKAFHSVVLNSLRATAQREEAAESQRLNDKVQSDLLRMKDAYFELASILYPEATVSSVEIGQDPLLTASQLVGNALHITIKAYPRALTELSQNRALLNIAAASRVRIRKVALRGEWWHEDNGPLLAFQGEERHPVALLPTSTRSYVLIDPVTQTRQPVDAALARQLDFHGVSFYRPFPDRPLRAMDLLRFGLQACRRDLMTLLLMGLLVGLLGITMPIAVGAIFDTIIPSAQPSLLLQISVLLLVVALSTAAFQITRDLAVLRIEGKMEVALESATFDRLLDLPPAFFRNYTAGDLGLRALGIGVIRQTLSRVAVSALLSSVFSIFNLILLFFYSAPLAVAALVLVLILTTVIIAAGYIQVRYERAMSAVQGRISGTVLQFINGIAKFRVAGAEQRAFAFWARAFSEQRRLAYKARLVANRLAIFTTVFSVVASMIIFWLTASSAGQLSTGGFLAFNAAFVQFLANAVALGTAFTAVLQVVPIYERVQPLLHTLPEVDDAKSDPGELSGSIEVSHISFRYTPNGPLILTDVSLQINPNEFVAFVGPSGSGKSTILRLLLGFETPEAGAILFDGHDLSGLDVRAVRRQIGVVLQSGKVMSADIYTNIAGSSGLSMDDAWEAARMAGLEEDIIFMPMGMQTVVNEGGSTLSGGQRQRLLIARAIASKPRIIFFDEATSALDNRTQEIISKSLESLAATKVVIAHRLSTIINADRIYVVAKGQIVQSGTYQELIQQSGLFAELATRQLA
jgi:NHLM bacteriocin system ABC transporter ATP-binding protein